MKKAKQTEMKLWTRPAISYDQDCAADFATVRRDLIHFSEFKSEPNNSPVGIYVADLLFLVYAIVLVWITHVYIKTRFEEFERKNLMLVIAGSSLVASTAIYATLILPSLP